MTYSLPHLPNELFATPEGRNARQVLQRSIAVHPEWRPSALEVSEALLTLARVPVLEFRHVVDQSEAAAAGANDMPRADGRTDASQLANRQSDASDTAHVPVADAAGSQMEATLGTNMQQLVAVALMALARAQIVASNSSSATSMEPAATDTSSELAVSAQCGVCTTEVTGQDDQFSATPCNRDVSSPVPRGIAQSTPGSVLSNSAHQFVGTLVARLRPSHLKRMAFGSGRRHGAAFGLACEPGGSSLRRSHCSTVTVCALEQPTPASWSGGSPDLDYSRIMALRLGSAVQRCIRVPWAFWP
jgi:hypothetical protein